MKNLGVSKTTKKWAEDKLKKDSERVIRQQKVRGGLWREIELNLYSERILNPTLVANTVGKMSTFLSYEMIDDSVGLICASKMDAKLYKADGTQFAYNDKGMIASMKPRDTFFRELVSWNYDIRYDLSFVEQMTKQYDEPLTVTFPKSGYFWLPKSVLHFQINSSVLFDVTPHANSRFFFKCYLFTESYSVFVDLRAKGMLPLPEGLGDPPLGCAGLLREGEIDPETIFKKNYKHE